MSGAAKPAAFIRVDRTLCSGHALCAARAPELFILDDNGYCIADGHPVPAESLARARLGARSCPEGALTIDEKV